MKYPKFRDLETSKAYQISLLASLYAVALLTGIDAIIRVIIEGDKLEFWIKFVIVVILWLISWVFVRRFRKFEMIQATLDSAKKIKR